VRRFSREFRASAGYQVHIAKPIDASELIAALIGRTVHV